MQISESRTGLILTGLFSFESDEHKDAAFHTRDIYQGALSASGYGPITTEIAPLGAFYPAEEYHQDYLKKNPNPSALSLELA